MNSLEFESFIKPLVSDYFPLAPRIAANRVFVERITPEIFKTGFLNRFWTWQLIENIADHLPFEEIRTILDVGSRDALQSIEFARIFPQAKIYAFEPTRAQYKLCKKNAKGYPQIEIIERACSNVTGKVQFFEVKRGNVGASSLLEVNDHPRSSEWRQKRTIVKCVRIDEWAKLNSIQSIDILWVDVQGAEKLVFEGVGRELLSSVKAIATEVEREHLYNGSILFAELNEFLESNNFKIMNAYRHGDDRTEADVVYLNRKYIE